MLTEEEKEFVKRGEYSSFFKLWTAKEALIKTGRFMFADALKTSFIKNRQISPPDEFSLTQRMFDEYALSVIELK